MTWLPRKSRHTRPDPRIRKHSRTKCLPQPRGPGLQIKENAVTGICQASHLFCKSPFFVVTSCRTVAYTCVEVPKCLETRKFSPKKRCIKWQTINLALPRRIRAEMVLVRMSWMLALRNLCQTVSTDYHWNQDRPDMKHGRPKCVPTKWARAVVSKRWCSYCNNA